MPLFGTKVKANTLTIDQDPQSIFNAKAEATQATTQNPQSQQYDVVQDSTQDSWKQSASQGFSEKEQLQQQIKQYERENEQLIRDLDMSNQINSKLMKELDKLNNDVKRIHDNISSFQKNVKSRKNRGSIKANVKEGFKDTSAVGIIIAIVVTIFTVLVAVFWQLVGSYLRQQTSERKPSSNN